MIACVLLLAACGQRHAAKNTVEQFLNDNVQKPQDLAMLYFGQIDSTRTVNDSAIDAMRKSTAQLQIFNKDIKYAERTPGEKLLFIRASYLIGKDTIESTFYINKTSQEVVALKSNVKNAENIK